MYWYGVLYRLFIVLNMLLLLLIMLGVPILIFGFSERLIKDKKQEYFIHNKVFKLAIVCVIISILIFLFIPSTFIVN